MDKVDGSEYVNLEGNGGQMMRYKAKNIVRSNKEKKRGRQG